MIKGLIVLGVIGFLDGHEMDGGIEQGSHTELPSDFKGIADNIKDYIAPGGDIKDNRYIPNDNVQDCSQGRYSNPISEEAYRQYNDMSYDNQNVKGHDSYPNMSQNSPIDIGFNSNSYADQYSNNDSSIEHGERQGGSKKDTNMLYGNGFRNQYDKPYHSSRYDKPNNGNQNSKPDYRYQINNPYYGNQNYEPDYRYQSNYLHYGNQYYKPFYDNKNDDHCQKANLLTVKEFYVEYNSDQNNQTGQCTEWVDGRYYETRGVHVPFNSNAHYWDNAANSNKSWEVNTVPSVGSIMVLEKGIQNVSKDNGHVAFVESYSGNSICTSNWNAPNLYKTTYINFKTGPGVSFLTYIGL